MCSVYEYVVGARYSLYVLKVLYGICSDGREGTRTLPAWWLMVSPFIKITLATRRVRVRDRDRNRDRDLLQTVWPFIDATKILSNSLCD